MRFFIFFLLLINSWYVTAQFNYELAGGTQHNAIGQASVALDGSLALLNNPAGLVCGLTKFGTLDVLKRYNIRGLEYYSLGLGTSNNEQGIAIRFLHTGLDDYKETNIGLAYARKVHDKIRLGIRFHYNNLYQEEFDSYSALTFDIGLLSQVSNKVKTGIIISNPTNRQIDNEYTIHSHFRIGLKYEISRDLSLLAELQKVVDYDVNLKTGINYRLNEKFNFMVGVIPTVSEFTFGFSYQFTEGFDLSSVFMYDQRIDISPGFGISYAQ